ncbi:MAG: heme exporter protein CcmD [Pseudomonadota bacterium]
MYWNSLSDFYAMGGYALYVWGSLALCSLMLGLETSLLIRHRQQLWQNLYKQARQKSKKIDSGTGATN